jgi:ATP-dependent DNA helicase RecG
MKNNLLPKEESEIVEFKKSTSSIKEGLMSLAAMLNKYHQGTVYFGIDNNGGIIGQIISDGTLKSVVKNN